MVIRRHPEQLGPSDLRDSYSRQKLKQDCIVNNLRKGVTLNFMACWYVGGRLEDDAVTIPVNLIYHCCGGGCHI